MPAPDQRVIIGRLDPEPLQHRIAEEAHWLVDRVRNQQMIAGFHEGQQRCGNRRETRRGHLAVMPAFKSRNGLSSARKVGVPRRP